MSYTPTTRKPTGIPAAPLIMVSGPAKSGKSMTAYKLGLSDLIHQCWVVDLGEGSADEYGGLNCYELLEWGRSWSDLQDTVKWCVAQPCPDGKMNALIIDSGTEVWDGLKSRADKRARNSKRNREALANDPDFEVDVSMPFWNDAKEAWARIVSPMKLAGRLVGVVLVRSETVAEVVNGAPTNRKVTSYQCEKTLQGIATAHVAVQPDHSARLVEVRSLRVSVPPKGVVLDDANPLGDLLERLSPTAEFAAPDVTTPKDDERGEVDEDEPPAKTPGQLLLDALMDAPDEVKAIVKAFAAENGKKYTAPAFDADPVYAEQVADILNQQVAA